MKYYIVNQHDKALSHFASNDFTANQLHFKRTDCYFFNTAEEAERFINHIQGHASARTKPAALKLRISTSAAG